MQAGNELSNILPKPLHVRKKPPPKATTWEARPGVGAWWQNAGTSSNHTAGGWFCIADQPDNLISMAGQHERRRIVIGMLITFLLFLSRLLWQGQEENHGWQRDQPFHGARLQQRRWQQLRSSYIWLWPILVGSPRSWWVTLWSKEIATLCWL